MASAQETIYELLLADTTLTDLVGDHVYPGQVPDDEDPAPWIFYAMPETLAGDTLDDDGTSTGEVEFHILADTYAEAKALADRLVELLNGYSGGQVRRSLWVRTSEESTEDGYHHVVRFAVWAYVGTTLPENGPTAAITRTADSWTITAGGSTLTIDSNGVQVDGAGLATAASVAALTSGLTADRLVGFADGSLATVAALGTGTANIELLATARTAAAVPLVVKGATAHATDLFQAKDGVNSTVFSINAAGSPTIGGGSGTSALPSIKILNEATVSPVIAFVSTNNGEGLKIYSGTTKIAQIQDNGYIVATTGYQVSSGLVFNNTGFQSGTAHYFGLGTIGESSHTLSSNNQVSQQIACQMKSSTTNGRDAIRVDNTWAESTDASRKARSVFTVYDTSAREFMRAEASGAAPMIGFLGAAATTRPDVTGSRGGNAALASLLTALATLGLITDSSTA